MEFCSNSFENFLVAIGIKHEKMNTHNSMQNGVVEKFNYSAMDAFQTLLTESKPAERFWREALLCFTYAWNPVCHKSFDKTPFESYGRIVPSVRHLKVSGSTVYVRIPKHNSRKLDFYVKKGILVGYDFCMKSYCTWIYERDKMVETINVKILEKFRNMITSNQTVFCLNECETTELRGKDDDSDFGSAFPKPEKIKLSKEKVGKTKLFEGEQENLKFEGIASKSPASNKLKIDWF